MSSDGLEALSTPKKRSAEDALKSSKHCRCDIEEIPLLSQTIYLLRIPYRSADCSPVDSPALESLPEVLSTPKKRSAETAFESSKRLRCDAEKDHLSSQTNSLPSTPRRSTRLVSQNSQQTPERRHWDPLKRLMIAAGVGSKNPPASPTVRAIYRQVDMGAFFSFTGRWKGKTIFQSDQLFDPNALVLKEKGKWETNKVRMTRGCAPIGHKGISKCAGRLDLSKQEIDQIRHSQRLYRIELQHVTQKDTGLREDPIWEMTHDAHMGEDTRHVVDYPEGGGVSILLSSLKKADALNWLADNPHPGREIIANVLHFRAGDSLIDRSAFSAWKKSYWEERARKLQEEKELEEKARKPLPSPRLAARRLFLNTA